MQLEVGAILEGKVRGITAFGAFVALPGGRSGLVHISEVADTYVRDVHDFLTEEQPVKVKVIGINPQGKISLSVKQAAERPPQPPRRPQQRRPEPERAGGERYVPQPSGDRNFEDKLKRFMQESDGKMSGNRLYQQQKRGQRGRRK